jgi:hypothetical protein
MELNKIKSLNELNSILNETINRGVNNAVQAKWGGRDFILTDENGTKTNVKMKDLVNKFQELSNQEDADKNLINNITKNIIKLNLRGDVELEKYGEISKLVRDSKNIFNPSHMDVIAFISKKHLFNSPKVKQRIEELKNGYEN